MDLSASTRFKTRLLVVQPTPFCNIDCKYCYLGNRGSKERMSLADAGLMFSRVLAFPTFRDDVTIVWHAGEPLSVPIEYFRSLVGAALDARPAGLDVRFAIQTNGTLINDAWCDLFKEFHFSVGLSIDGPKHINDENRVTRAGRGTFDAALRGLNLLRAHNIPFHVISVLTGRSLLEPDAIFDFYDVHDIRRIAFNIEEKEGRNLSSSLEASENLEHYRSFLLKFIRRAKSHHTPIDVRELENTLRAIYSWTAGEMRINEQVEPFGIISMDLRGNLSTYSPELLGAESDEYNNFVIGNALTDTFQAICDSQNFRNFSEAVARGVEACRKSCQYFDLCGGGAPSNKFYENGSFDSTETFYCRYSTIIPTELVLKLVAGASANAGRVDVA